MKYLYQRASFTLIKDFKWRKYENYERKDSTFKNNIIALFALWAIANKVRFSENRKGISSSRTIYDLKSQTRSANKREEEVEELRRTISRINFYLLYSIKVWRTPSLFSFDDEINKRPRNNFNAIMFAIINLFSIAYHFQNELITLQKKIPK